MSFSISKVQYKLLLVLAQLYRNYNTLYKNRSYFRLQTKTRSACSLCSSVQLLEENVIFETTMMENTYMNSMVIFII